MTQSVEQFANLATSTLNGALLAGATSLTVASAASFPSTPQFRLVVDQEIFLVTGISGSVFTVVPGYENSPMAPHASGATVKLLLTAGIMQAAYPQGRQVSGTGPASMGTLDGILEVAQTTAFVVNLPADPILYKPYFVSDVNGAAFTHNITAQDTGTGFTDTLTVAHSMHGYFFNGTAWNVYSQNGLVTMNPATILANPTGSPAPAQSATLDDSLGFHSGVLGTAAKLPNHTSGAYTLQLSDYGREIISTDPSPVNLFLPAGLPAGFWCYSYQGSSGQVSYVPSTGAAILDGVPRSAGPMSTGNWVRISNLGNDQYLVIGNTTTGLVNWSIVGNTSIREGDAATYVIWRPDSTNAYPAGVTLQVDGTGFSTAGFSTTLVQALTSLALLDPNVTFDGVDLLTIKPGAMNPLPLNFFATPTYTAVGNRSVTITISNPSVGAVANASVTTQINNVSKPTTPDLLFPPMVVNSSAVAASGQAVVAMNSVAALTTLMTVTGSASIPAQTWIASIDPVHNTVTLSANLTGSIAQGTALTFKPPGIWFDMSDTSTMVMDGSNNVASLADKINGYLVTQATTGNKPVYTANALNGLGGLTFTTSKSLNTTTAKPIINFLDAARQRSTIIMVSKITSSGTGTSYFGGIPSNAAYLQNNTVYAGGMGFQAPAKEMNDIQGVGRPFIWSTLCDGTSQQTRMNGQQILIPATLTADFTAGSGVATVDDTSSINISLASFYPHNGGLTSTVPDQQGNAAFGNMTVSSISDAVTLHFNQANSATVTSGTEIYFFNPISVNTNGAPFSAHTSTSFVLGSPRGLIYELIVVPRVLSPQEWRGVHLYLSNKWSTSTTQTTGAAASAGTKAITLSSVTGIAIGQVVSGTGIKPGSTVVKVNTTTKVITLNELIVAPGVGNGATLTFAECGWKQPDLLDITQFFPTYFDALANGAQLANSGKGTWQPYLGSVTAPFQVNGQYSATGHGSSEYYTASNIPTTGNELSFDLDVLNYSPYLNYNPFSTDNPPDVPKGELVITASPTPAAIANLIGYNPPQPLAYPYVTGRLKTLGAFYQQYGYYEWRFKGSDVLGVWIAFWSEAADGSWPPEIDVTETYGRTPGVLFSTVHSSTSFSETFSPNEVNVRNLSVDISAEYILLGVDVAPDKTTFYLNREKYARMDTPWDLHIPNYYILQNSMKAAEGADGVTPAALHIDYFGAWKRNPQTPTVPTSTQAETTARIAAMTGTPSGGRQTLINTLIASLKSYTTSNQGQTLWQVLDFLYLANFDAQSTRINWKNPAQIATEHGSPTFVADRGYSGVLSTLYVDTGINLSTSGFQCLSPLNLCHLGTVVANVTRTDAIAVGTPNDFYIRPKSGNSVAGLLNGTSAKATNTASTPTGNAPGSHYVVTRNHFHHGQFYQNGTFASGLPQQGTDTQTIENANILIANGTSQVACAHGGTYLSPDDIGYLYTLIYNYLHAIGAM